MVSYRGLCPPKKARDSGIIFHNYLIALVQLDLGFCRFRLVLLVDGIRSWFLSFRLVLLMPTKEVAHIRSASNLLPIRPTITPIPQLPHKTLECLTQSDPETPTTALKRHMGDNLV